MVAAVSQSDDSNYFDPYNIIVQPRSVLSVSTFILTIITTVIPVSLRYTKNKTFVTSTPNNAVQAN